MFKPRSIIRYTNVSWFLKQGQQNAYLRNEPHDHPCNTIPMPDEVWLYIAEVRGGKTGDPERYRAYFEVNIFPETLGITPQATFGLKRIEVSSGKTRTEVKRALAFDLGYSMYADSVWYREFRKCYGFSERSAPYQTEAMKKESERRAIGAMAVAAGASPEDL